jgi:predicted HicB family RNase H-like nuclease
MTDKERTSAIKKLAKLRDLVEHPATPETERTAALEQIQKLKAKWKIGQYEQYDELKPGRPKSPPQNIRNIVMRFRVTKSEKQLIVTAAKEAGKSLSDYIRGKVFKRDSPQITIGKWEGP